MIRLVYVLRRLPNLSLEEFQSYWRENHGPLAAKHSTVLGIRRYVQSHTLDDPLNKSLRERRGTLEPYDGLAELWLKNQGDLTEDAKTQMRQAGEELLEDEKEFIDFSRSSMWYATELPQVNPSPENIVAKAESGILKLCYFLRPPSDMSLEEAQLYWRVHHGPLVRSLAPALKMKRYMQVHQMPGPQIESLRKPRGKMEEPFMGQAEAWFDRVERAAVAESPEVKRAFDLLIEDEAKFIDFSRSVMWVSKEHVFVDR